MSRPGASKLCVLSFAMVLLAFVLTVVRRDVGQLAPGRELGIIFAIVFLVFALAGLALGLVGIVDYSLRSQRYGEGRRYAILSIGLSTLILAALAVNVAVRVRQGSEPRRNPAVRPLDDRP